MGRKRKEGKDKTITKRKQEDNVLRIGAVLTGAGVGWVGFGWTPPTLTQETTLDHLVNKTLLVGANIALPRGHGAVVADPDGLGYLVDEAEVM